MQPDISSASLTAIKNLILTVEYFFISLLMDHDYDLCLFESCSNMTFERNYYSFVGKVACGRFYIAAYRKYFLGTNFYWLCHCSVIKEVLEFNGSIHQLKCWTQEILAYDFVIIHRVSKMMKDVDAISCYIDPLINIYLVTAFIMRNNDVRQRIFDYNFNIF